MRILVVLFVLSMVACASGRIEEAWQWERPCATEAELEADTQVCQTEAIGMADPSRAVEFSRSFFDQCMERRGWQRTSGGKTTTCDQDPNEMSNRPLIGGQE